MDILPEISPYLSDLLTFYGTINLALVAIRYVRSKIGTRPPPKPGTDCPKAGIKIIDITYNINITYNEHHYPPCTHSGKATRRRRGRSGRRRSSRRR